MNRSKRRFLKAGAGLAAILIGGARSGVAQPRVEPETPPAEVLLQTSPLAGFQYHQGERLWSRLRTGQPLVLQREEDNPYDGKAVMVLWNGKKLGYVPRAANVAVSQMLDRGQTLRARITGLKDSSNPWERIQMDILMETRPGQA